MNEIVRYRSHAEFLRKTGAAYRRGRREGIWISCRRTAGSTPYRGSFEVVVSGARTTPPPARNGNVYAQAVRRSEGGDLEAVRELRRAVRGAALRLAKGVVASQD